MHDEPAPAAWHGYVDGRLPAAEQARLEAQLHDDPGAAATVAAWAAQRDALRALHADLLAGPVPDALLESARALEGQSRQAARWQRWGGMAAALLLAFGAGWGMRGEWAARTEAGWAAPGTPPEFGRQALLAHVAYAPEVRHPVEVAAAQRQHLVQWLSRRLGRPLTIPNLQPQGYALVGGRLLPGEAGARAQFMFEDARGGRLTLYVGAVAPGSASARETAFRFAGEADGVASFYWVDQGFGYALAARLGRTDLLQLAEAVHRQL